MVKEQLKNYVPKKKQEGLLKQRGVPHKMIRKFRKRIYSGAAIPFPGQRGIIVDGPKRL